MVQTQIRYITPYSADRNIGAAYNQAISELPDDCYIVIRDGDTMFLTPDWGRQIEQIIVANPEYSVITCMTNRLGLPECLVDGVMNDADIAGQIETAYSRWNDFGTSVKLAKVAPGMLMIFHKSVWGRCKFRENSIIFDREFSNSVLRSGGKIGIAQGFYIFHLYRYGMKKPQSYVSHLK